MNRKTHQGFTHFLLLLENKEDVEAGADLGIENASSVVMSHLACRGRDLLHKNLPRNLPGHLLGGCPIRPSPPTCLYG